MNPSFILILKSERCRYKQNRQLSSLVKGDTKIVNLKVKVKAQVKSNSCSQNLNPQKKSYSGLPVKLINLGPEIIQTL